MSVSPYDHGVWNCQQDYDENSAFYSLGGVGARQTGWVRPSWLPEADFAEYVRGYEDMARRMFGPDWRTVPFGWAPTFTLSKEPTP